MNHLLINSDLVKKKHVSRSLKRRRFGIIATSTFCALYINHLTFFRWDVPRHITLTPPPPPPTKTKKDFMQVRPKLTKGQAKHLDLTPDILAIIVCSTDQPSGAGSLRCRLGKTKVIMNERMISHVLKKAWYNSRQEVRETRWRLRQTQSHFPSWFVDKLVPS